MSPLHAAGWNDVAIYFVITVCALFNFYKSLHRRVRGTRDVGRNAPGRGQADCDAGVCAVIHLPPYGFSASRNSACSGAEILAPFSFRIAATCCVPRAISVSPRQYSKLRVSRECAIASNKRRSSKMNPV
jgi:hypothetical protein